MFKLPVRKQYRPFDVWIDVVDADDLIIAEALDERHAGHLVKVLNNWDRVNKERDKAVKVLKLCDWYLDKDESHPVAWLTVVTAIKDILKEIDNV